MDFLEAWYCRISTDSQLSDFTLRSLALTFYCCLKKTVFVDYYASLMLPFRTLMRGFGETSQSDTQAFIAFCLCLSLGLNFILLAGTLQTRCLSLLLDTLRPCNSF